MQNPHRAGNLLFVAAWALLVALLASGPVHAWGILVQLNRPPAIAGIPGESVTSGQAYSFAPSASDPDGDPLTFSIENRPAWASFSTSSGELSGTPGASDVGTYPDITITVSDGKASATLGPFSITVVAANRPPVIGGTPAGSVIAGFAYSFTPSASDPDGDTLTYSIVNRPAWASFSTSTGRLSGTPTAAQVGTYSNIRITVSDGEATDTLGPFSITVREVSRSATVSWTPPTTYVDGSPITNLAGFKIFYGQSLLAFTRSVTIPSPDITSAVIEELGPGTWYFAVKAYTTANVESDFSLIRQKTFP